MKGKHLYNSVKIVYSGRWEQNRKTMSEGSQRGQEISKSHPWVWLYICQCYKQWSRYQFLLMLQKLDRFHRPPPPPDGVTSSQPYVHWHPSQERWLGLIYQVGFHLLLKLGDSRRNGKVSDLPLSLASKFCFSVKLKWWEMCITKYFNDKIFFL